MLQTTLVELRAVLGNAGANQRAHQPARHAARAGAGQSGRNGTERDEANPGKRDGADRGRHAERRAECSTDGGADTGTFGGLGAELGLARVIREMPLAGLLGHHHVDVVTRVAAARHRLVCPLGAVAISEHSGHHAAGLCLWFPHLSHVEPPECDLK